MPIESEWVYDCRAGTTTAFNTGANITSTQANFDANASYAGSAVGDFRKKTVPVKSFKPNPFGLHNMHGNVEELCWDFVSPFSATAVRDPIVSMMNSREGNLRVSHGGSWVNFAPFCRSSVRMISHPGYSFPDLGDFRDRGYQGFRLVVSADAK